MARRRFAFMVPVEAEPDTRPHGTVLFADPSMAGYTENIRTCDPFRPDPDHDDGRRQGVRSINKRHLPFYDPQWDRRHPKDDDGD